MCRVDCCMEKSPRKGDIQWRSVPEKKKLISHGLFKFIIGMYCKSPPPSPQRGRNSNPSEENLILSEWIFRG